MCTWYSCVFCEFFCVHLLSAVYASVSLSCAYNSCRPTYMSLCTVRGTVNMGE